MILATYFRSTAAYRVRIALNFKGIEHQLEPVNLLTGEHHQADYKRQNPEGLLPILKTGDTNLAQSMAILEYLEEAHPQPALLPQSLTDRAYVRGLAQAIVADIHPLNNLRVLKYLVNTVGVNEEQKLEWYHHWIKQGFDSLEQRLSTSSATGLCCFGDTPSLADICLVPQVYNAKRFDCPLDDYPLINRIDSHCLSLDAFADARPEAQTDAK